MTKLSALLKQIIDQATTRLNDFIKFLKDVVEQGGTYTYQDVKLLNFNISNESVKKLFSDIINDLTVKCNERFEILQSNPLFNVINVFDCRQWRKGANLWSLGENEITELINNFNILLTKNN